MPADDCGQVAPRASLRQTLGPYQALPAPARIAPPGSTMRSWTGQPSHSGPRIDQSRRASSLSRMKAPFLVPTSSRVRVIFATSTAGLERVDDPAVRLHGVHARSAGDARALGLEMEDGGRGDAAGLEDAVRDRVDGGAAVPDLVDDQDALAAEQRVGRELQERRARAGLPLVVVVLDRRDEDVPDP